MARVRSEQGTPEGPEDQLREGKRLQTAKAECEVWGLLICLP